MFAAYGVLYAATLTIAKYLGAQKRILDRAELRMGEDTQKESVSDEVGY